MSNPYAQQPPTDPYAQPAVPSDQPTWSPAPPDPYGQPMGQGQYGQPQYGGQYPAYGQSPYATGTRTPTNTSAILLTVLSALSLCNIVAIGSLVLGIVALTKTSADPEGSHRLTKIGWIVFAVGWAVAIVGIVGLVVLGVVAGDGGSSNFNSGF